MEFFYTNMYNVTAGTCRVVNDCVCEISYVVAYNSYVFLDSTISISYSYLFLLLVRSM